VDVARKMPTVWRAVATGERWLRESGGCSDGANYSHFIETFNRSKLAI